MLNLVRQFKYDLLLELNFGILLFFFLTKLIYLEESQGWTVECSTSGREASALLVLLAGSLMGCRIDEGIRHLAPVMDSLSELSQSKPGMTSNFLFLKQSGIWYRK